MRRWGLRIDLAAALIGFAYFLGQSQFPWHLATLAGLAVGVGSFFTRRTLSQLRGLHSPIEEEAPASEETEPETNRSPSRSDSTPSSGAGN